MALFLLLSVVALLVWDVLSTQYVLDHGGTEVNPAMRALMSAIGVPAALVLPKLFIMGGALYVWFEGFYVIPVLAILALIYMAVGLFNLRSIRNIK